MKLFYEPNNAYFGDCMPFYHDDTFYVFHQRDARNPRPFEPFEWSLATTKDFVHYEDKGVAIPKEGDDSPEQYIFAGSVFEGNHKFHAIYTAYNRDFAAQGKDAQVLMSAESDDLLNWKKTGKFVLPAPEGYDGNDWRDPFILWEEESQQYIMILGARKLKGKQMRTGRTVWFTSKDLSEWHFEGDFWAPETFTMHEMPDLFKMGDWWYLLTTEYSERSKTIYRMSRSLKGPWIAPADDAFDGRAYYAARSCSDGKHRYLFGWAATKTDNQDMNSWDWAGTFECHEIYQRPDGTLGVKLPDSMLSAYEPDTEVMKGPATLETVDSQANLHITETPEDFYKVEMDFQISENTRMFGIRLFEDPETGDSYKYEVNLAENRIYFDRTPNQPWYRYFDKGLERPIHLEAGRKYHARLIVDDSIVIMYIDGVSLIARMHAKAGCDLSAYVIDGSLKIENITIAKSLRS